MNTNIKNSVLDHSGYRGEKRTPSTDSQIKQIQFYLGEFETLPTATPLSNFSLTLLAGQNPANIVPLHLGDVSIFKLGLALAHSSASADALELLPVWAEIESMNMGSHQRLDCPLTLYGSGRWGAQDQGGHYSALLSLLAGGFQTIEFSEVTRKFIGLDTQGVVDALLTKREALYATLEEERKCESFKEDLRCKMLYALCDRSLNFIALREAVKACEAGSLRALEALGLEVIEGDIVPIGGFKAGFDFSDEALSLIVEMTNPEMREALISFLDVEPNLF